MFFDQLGTFINAFGALQTSSAQTKAAVFNKNNSLFNAQVAQVQGDLQTTQVRDDARRQIGQMVANAGASGFDSSSGSAADVIAQSQYQANLAVLTSKYNTQAKVANFNNEANMYGSAAKSSKISGLIGAGSAILKGESNAYKHDTDYGAGTTPFQLGGGSTSGTYK